MILFFKYTRTILRYCKQYFHQLKYGSFIVCVQQTSKVHSTVLRNTNFKAKFTVLVMCHPTLFVSFIPSTIVDNQESPDHDWCLNTKTRESYTIKYNTILFIDKDICSYSLNTKQTAILNSWQHLDFQRYFSTPDNLSVAKEEMQFYISKYTHSCVSNTFILRLCITISGIIQLLKFPMLCAMYLFISYIQATHITLKNLLDIEILWLKQNP